MDGPQVQSRWQDDPHLDERVAHPSDRRVHGRHAADVHGTPQLEEHPPRGIVLARLPVRHLGLDRRADPHLERRERHQGLRAQRGPHRARAVRAVQPQVHADGLGLQEHGLLAAQRGRGYLRQVVHQGAAAVGPNVKNPSPKMKFKKPGYNYACNSLTNF